MHGYQSPQKIELFQLFQSYIMSALQEQPSSLVKSMALQTLPMWNNLSKLIPECDHNYSNGVSHPSRALDNTFDSRKDVTDTLLVQLRL